jgi:hypothetical protein
MARVHLLGATVLFLSVLTACDVPHSPTAPASTPSVPPTLVIPAIRGGVREANGGPLAEVRIRQQWNGVQVTSDQSGAFEFAEQPCRGTGVNFLTSAAGYWFPLVPIPTCRSDANHPQVTVEIKGQPRLSLTPEMPLQTILSNDDLAWVDDSNGYSCGPCKRVLLERHLTFPLEVRVDWDSVEPMNVWLEGINDDYDTVRLAERVAAAGEHSITIGISDNWSYFLPYTLKVGVPIESRGVSGVVAVRVSARAVAP